MTATHQHNSAQGCQSPAPQRFTVAEDPSPACDAAAVSFFKLPAVVWLVWKSRDPYSGRPTRWRLVSIHTRESDARARAAGPTGGYPRKVTCREVEA